MQHTMEVCHDQDTGNVCFHPHLVAGAPGQADSFKLQDSQLEQYACPFHIRNPDGEDWEQRLLKEAAHENDTDPSLLTVGDNP
jgi:hypothetical protein